MPKVKQSVTKAVVQRMVRAALDGELEMKWHTQIANGTAILLAGTMLQLTTIPQGSTANNRTGDRVKLKRLTFSYGVLCSVGGVIFSAADYYDRVRLIIFRYHASTAVATPGAADLLNGGLADLITASYNVNQENDVTILWDSAHTVYNTPVYDGTNVKLFPGPDHVWQSPRPIVITNFDKPARMAPKVRALNTEPNVVDFLTGSSQAYGHLYLFSCSDSAFTPHPTLNFECTLEYHDA